jgi:tRNA (adenine37-N6)-methyltransferase
VDDPSDLHDGEIAVNLPPRYDASIYFVGCIRTPYARQEDCPRQARLDGPACRIEIFEPWIAALSGIEAHEGLEVLYWLDRSRRDLVWQNPRNRGETSGTFAFRSPIRPNPIGTTRVRLLRVDGPALLVRGLDCIDGTPLII